MLGGLQFAECLVYSINFGELQEAGWDNAYPLLLKACLQLQASGADAIVLCANTAHLHAVLIQAKLQIPLIHVVDATAIEIKQKGLKTVGLLGTKLTMESKLYDDTLQQAGIQTLIPPDPKTRDYIQLTLKEELGRGILCDETKKSYLAVMEEFRRRGAEGVILGCTEIPLLIAQKDFDLPLFDTTRIHAQAAVKFALS